LTLVFDDYSAIVFFTRNNNVWTELTTLDDGIYDRGYLSFDGLTFVNTLKSGLALDTYIRQGNLYVPQSPLSQPDQNTRGLAISGDASVVVFVNNDYENNLQGVLHFARKIPGRVPLTYALSQSPTTRPRTNATYGELIKIAPSGNFVIVASLGERTFSEYDIYELSNNCRPEYTLSASRCANRIAACRARGMPMKWTGVGCRRRGRPVGDGGCQCAKYCGYSCRQSCTKDRECTWRAGSCVQKSTGRPGLPRTQC
jgi:hypothetical protein